MSPDPSPAISRLPSVDRVLSQPAAQLAIARYGRPATLNAVRQLLAAHREASTTAAIAELAEAARNALDRADAPALRPVLNLTGTVLHTNLGRAVLAEEAIEAATIAMRRAVNLEYDLESGRRGERDDHVRGLLRELTGAEDALVVNNNAAAVLLALASLSPGRETIVSRGELIEIGGSFRIPDIMRRAGAKLREVGTTNRTHPADYRDAIGPRTAAIMKVHTSNYRIEGFTAEVAPKALSAITREAGLPLIDDLGSGTLIDLTRFGLPRERTVQDALEDGADLVTFSGDKLLGGPQVGVIAGRRDLVARCARNHLKRALRADKIRLAALEATLKLYRDPDRLAERLPVYRAFRRTRAELQTIAGRISVEAARHMPEGWRIEAVDLMSQIGSGAMPLETMSSAGLALMPPHRAPGKALDALAARLRACPVPVIGRIHDGALLLDLRCLDDETCLLAQFGHLGAPA